MAKWGWEGNAERDGWVAGWDPELRPSPPGGLEELQEGPGRPCVLGLQPPSPQDWTPGLCLPLNWGCHILSLWEGKPGVLSLGDR